MSPLYAQHCHWQLIEFSVGDFIDGKLWGEGTRPLDRDTVATNLSCIEHVLDGLLQC